MASQHPQNASQLEYSLPGIMHYLQKETTKNERDRVQWESERAQMKTVIAKLEGENKSLKEQVQKLRSELDDEKRVDQNKVNKTEVTRYKFKEVDISPLATAREKLQSQIKEIGYILNTTPIDPVKFDLNSDRQYYSTNPNNHIDDSTAESSLNSKEPVPNNVQLASPTEDSSNASTPESDNEVALSKSLNETPEQFNPATNEIESDAETVIEESEASVPSSHHAQSLLKFALASHISTVTSLAVNDKYVLAAGKDGFIHQWDIQNILNSNGNELSPTFTYRSDSKPISAVKWIEKDTFVTVSSESVKFWKVGAPKFALQIKLSGVQKVDARANQLILKTTSATNFYKITHTTANQLRFEHDKAASFGNCDFAVLDPEDQDRILLISAASVQIYSLSKHNSTSPVLPGSSFPGKQLTDFSIQNGLLSYVLNKNEVVLYNRKEKSVKFNQKYDVEIANVKVNKNHIIVFLTNGDVKVYESKNTEQIYKEYNIYKLFSSDFSKLKKEDKATLKGSLLVGDLIFNDYVLAGCEDAVIRGFKIS